MDYNSSAKKILKNLGGEENIVNIEHCSTRLRITVSDQSKVDEEALKKIDGVMGVILATQVQVIIGNNVIEMYDAFVKVAKPKALEVKTNKNIGKLILDFIVAIFQPLVPAIAGAGILKSLLILLSTFNLVESSSGIYIVLSSISDTTFYYLPLMVAFTTATKLNTNKLVALVAASCLLLPNNVKLISEGFSIFGMGVKNVAYNSQVFPAIITVLFLGLLEKNINKISPKPIRVFFVPMVSLAITVPVSMLFLGPLGYTLGEYLTTFILWLYQTLGFLGIALLASILPYMVATGMHKAMVPYGISTYSKLGYEMMYLPASLAHNLSECGATLAVAIKSKNQKLKSTAASASISAAMGITEPALYGVTLQNKSVQLGVVLSSLLSGGLAGFFAIKCFVMAGPGLANITMWIDPNNYMNFIYSLISLVAAIVFSFIFTYIFFKEEQEKIEENLISPMKGQLISLENVNDEVFKTKTIGDGVAIIPTEGILKSPIDGKIKMVFETGHGLGLETENGCEVLFHIGIDTVNLKGKYFNVKVEKDQKVRKGDVLVEFDLEKIKEEGYDPTTMFIVTNSNEYNVIHQKENIQLKDNTVIFSVEKRG